MTNPTGPARQDGGTASASVATSLAGMIQTQLTPGALLPSEADLATDYGVSRLTIREAVKLLEGRGLLTLSRGRRAVVREPTGATFGDFLSVALHNDPKTLFDLVEVRLSLEVQSATLAAKRGTRAGFAAVESALAGMRTAAGEVAAGDSDAEDRFNRCDYAFHEALALASGNRVLSFLFEAMGAPLQQGFSISRRGHAARGHTLDDTVAAHQRILDCVVAGDSRASGDAMRDHLKDTVRDIRAAMLSLTAPPATP